MRIITEEIRLKRTREMEMRDITDDVRRLLGGSRMKEGRVTLFAVGSTCALVTVEFEPGLVKDIPEALERVAPRDIHYGHEAMWHDGNGHSHVRASLMRPDMTIPFVDGDLVLGTWQQVAFIECDVKPRDRRIVAQFVGE